MAPGGVRTAFSRTPHVHQCTHRHTTVHTSTPLDTQHTPSSTKVLPQDTQYTVQYTVRRPLRMSLLTGQLSDVYIAFMLRVFDVTFGIHKDKNKINMSMKTALLRTLNGFLSSPSAAWLEL